MKLKIPQATRQGYVEVGLNGAFDISYPSSKNRRGRVQGGGDISPTICSEMNGIVIFSDMKENKETKRPEGKGWCYDKENGKWFRVRKLTPRECFRLMDVKESDIDRMMATRVNEKNGKEEQIVSNSQLYKCAGNSIVVSCMYHLFKQVWFPEEVRNEEGTQLTLF